MTPDEEKRLQKIEEQWQKYNDPDTPEDAIDEIAYFEDMRDDIKWLIALVRDEQRAARWCRKNMIFPPEVQL